MMRVALTLAALGASVRAQSTEAPTLTVSTVVASPSAATSAPIASQSVSPPVPQAWCPSEIFCAGELLQAVNLGNLYTDPKTFVDKPTRKPSQEVLNDFRNVTNNATSNDLDDVKVGSILDFVEEDFGGEGLELQALALDNFNPEPSFLGGVKDPIVQAFAKTVHGYWTQLIRGTNSSTLCDGVECESSLIPLNHTFVVPGGRFREQYYWDSFWIVEGLLESELYDIVNATLHNFMDELEHIGFIPNGGRIYYLNRSQPPLFVQMLARYVEATNETTILERALPLAEKELAWFATNRTIDVTSPTTNKTYSMARYAVNNTAPRPESYLTDYRTANPDDNSTALTAEERGDLYAELASGAESGWDYTTRWIGGSNDLKKLNVRNTLPVDLNSILYHNHILLARLYNQVSNDTAADSHREQAATIREGVLDLFWNSTKLAFYDFNLKTNQQSKIFTIATFYPLWSGIIPPELLNSSDAAFGYFSSINLVMSRYNGTYPTTFHNTGLQWDAPNAWPPHVYIAMQALRALPENVTNSALPTPQANQSTYALIPEGQLGLEENALPGQPLYKGVNASSTGAEADVNVRDGTVVNGGNATEGEGWGKVLQREMANRYISAALCSWHATGGSLEGLLPRLSDEELNITNSINNTGNMFEKFSNLDIDSAGSGGEYTVQAGFGWTNGVVLWTASRYGDVLAAPQCPNVTDSAAASTGGGSGPGDTDGGNSSDASQGGEGSDNNAAASLHAGWLAAGMAVLAMTLSL
ncbi:glycoside hydrolase family 37 protein [Schizophyllum commune]